jgi:hypothetical protein
VPQLSEHLSRLIHRAGLLQPVFRGAEDAYRQFKTAVNEDFDLYSAPSWHHPDRGFLQVASCSCSQGGHRDPYVHHRKPRD